jgi:hypothetical protein
VAPLVSQALSGRDVMADHVSYTPKIGRGGDLQSQRVKESMEPEAVSFQNR